MKRDMELVRLLLLEQEAGEAPPELSSYSDDDKIYNLQLMQDAKLVVAHFISDAEGEAKGAIVQRLSWAGHDFLDATRDSKIWQKAKEHVLKPGASWTFDILKEWAKHEIKQKLGMP